MKGYAKICDALGLDTVKEMESADTDELKKIILEANQSMKQVQDELDDNERYQEIKAQKLAAEQAKKDVDKRQKAKIKFALQLLEEKGAIE